METESVLQGTASQSASEDSPLCKKRKLASLFKKRDARGEARTLSVEQKVKDEMERYLKCSQPDVESKPMEWWKVQAQFYPALYKLSRKYHYICATSEA